MKNVCVCEPPRCKRVAQHAAAAALTAMLQLHGCNPPAFLLRVSPAAAAAAAAVFNPTAAMSDKRMRPIVKLEPGGGDAQEQQAAAAATGGSRQRRRGDVGEEGAAAELELQQLMANAEAQAFALQGMEREMALGEQLLRAKEELLQAKG